MGIRLQQKTCLAAFGMLLLIVLLFHQGDVLSFRAPDNNAALGYEYSLDAAIYMPSFYRYAQQPLADSYTSEYITKALTLPGYRLLYERVATWMDPNIFSYYFACGMYILFCTLLGFFLWHMAGPLTCFLGVSMALSSDFMMAKMMLGGTSRTFAPVFLMLSILAVTFARPYLLLAVTVIASLFYPLATSVSGTAAFVWFVLLPKHCQGELVRSFSFSKRITLLAVAALLSSAAAMPTLLAGSEYGERVTRSNMLNYLETMEGGRYAFRGDALPNHLFDLKTMVIYYFEAFAGQGAPFVPIQISDEAYVAAVIWFGFLALLIMIAAAVCYRKNKDALLVRFASVCGCFVLLHIVSYVLVPYLYIPSRFLFYGIPLAIFCFLPIAFMHIFSVKTHHPQLWMLLLIGLFYVAIARQGNSITQWSVTVTEQTAPVYEAIKELPEHALIAGWPGGNFRSEVDVFMDSIPMISRRNVLLSLKRHQVMHTGYIMEMRGRMDAVLAVYTTPNNAALKHLKDAYGVTHFLVNKAHFEIEQPNYFEPWNSMLESEKVLVETNAYVYKILGQKGVVVFQYRDYYLLDIRDI